MLENLVWCNHDYRVTKKLSVNLLNAVPFAMKAINATLSALFERLLILLDTCSLDMEI